MPCPPYIENFLKKGVFAGHAGQYITPCVFFPAQHMLRVLGMLGTYGQLIAFFVAHHNQEVTL